MKCSKCTNDIPDTVKFCPYCGYRTPESRLVAENKCSVSVNDIPLYTFRENRDSENYAYAPPGYTPKKSLTKIICTVAGFCAMTALLIASIINGAQGWNKYYESAEEYDYWFGRYTELQQQLIETTGVDDFDKLTEKLEFYETNIVVIVSIDDAYYHTYGCKDCTPPFDWAGYVEYAKEDGFKPCPICQK